MTMTFSIAGNVVSVGNKEVYILDKLEISSKVERMVHFSSRIDNSTTTKAF